MSRIVKARRRNGCPCCPRYNWRERVAKRIAQRDLKTENWPEPHSFEWLVDLSDYEEMIQSDSDLHVEWVRFVEGPLKVGPGACGCNLCVLNGAA